jgi:putative ABC transport system substrate-binding protein
MKRREFLLGLGGAAAWPLAARAQAPTRTARIAVLLTNPESDADGRARFEALRKALQDLGWVEGRNLQMMVRWGVNDRDTARANVADVVAMSPDVIVSHGTPATAAVHAATRNIPVVFAVVTDPVGGGYIESLARPGGNITGFATFEPEMGSKWVELLHEVAPPVTRIGGIRDPDFKGFAALWATIEKTATQQGIATETVPFRRPTDDLDAAVAAFARQPGGRLIALPTAINNTYRQRIFSLAARHQLPAVYPFRHQAVEGGLLAYGFDSIDLIRRAAVYVDRILKGEKPANLAVQGPTKFDLTINLKTARAIGLAVPVTLLARADEVIE